ncbi:AraC family transcriptional regulator [Acinetobacter tianfuensis]|uniref:AraC family transcriptional regulator n=1 Tax=Acinetobacter tianfuensis TaxID=2419603 RepID=A0A3A8EC56_9GAMM|nr:AraC family transcriptional regulator [Acinetobacter tianfuensis]RKG32467.1 AraC family transcriptional regulator [Acinetobacter tianfuensis]
MHELHIPNGYFQLWQMYVAERGLNVQQLDFLAPYRQQLQQLLQLPIDSQSPASFFVSIMELTRQHLDCPQLVFEMAKFIRAEHFGVVGYMATRSNSVAEALQYIVRFSRLVIDGAEAQPLQIQQFDRVIALTWPRVSDKYMLLNELTSACMAHLAKQIFPASLQLLHIQFAHAPQIAKFHYEKFFGCQVSFSHDRYAFEFSSESLDLKSELADPSLMQLLLKQAEEAIASKPQAENVQLQLHMRVAEYLRMHAQPPKIEQLADELYMSVRTLQRQLSERQSSFKKVLEEERMKRCEQLLQQKITLTEIAEQLGYSDQSALARAYKASTGQTLLQRRKALKVE